MRRVGRHLAVLLAGVGAAAVLSGCVVISSTNGVQGASLGSVNLSISACADNSPGCSGTSNAGSFYDFVGMGGSEEVQVLLAIRLPEGSVPPDNLIATLGGGGFITFAGSPGYAAELQALEPAPAGERWWGWLSAKGTYSQKSAQSFSVSMDVTLPRPADGGPFASPMHWRPVVGGRVVNPELPASRPVKCGVDNDDLYNGHGESGGVNSVFCIDFPNPETTRGSLTVPIVDFGIVGGSVEASPGTALNAVFLAKRSGAPDAATVFSLAAQTGVPGGTVALDRPSIALSGDATQPIVATIGVPAGTPPGAYPVTLTATAPGKPQRSGVVTVTVPGAANDERPAIRNASLTRRRFRARPKRSRSGKAVPPKVGTKLKVDLSEKAELSIKVVKLGKRPKTLGTSTRSLPAGKSEIGIRKGIGRVALGTGRHRITLTAEDTAGQRSAPTLLTFTVVG